MALSGLLPLLKDLPAYRELLGKLADWSTDADSRIGVLEAAKPFLLAGLQADVARTTLVLVADYQQSRRLYEQIAAWSASPGQVLWFPAYHGLFYDRVPADPGTTQLRQATLAALANTEG
ncbi:MAG: hypothetical protein M0Z94_04825, partial [Dehalococcoidales bacterium]|nr:hypothetical protein [Dehalococcoidales bacterium]